MTGGDKIRICHLRTLALIRIRVLLPTIADRVVATRINGSCMSRYLSICWLGRVLVGVLLETETDAVQ